MMPKCIIAVELNPINRMSAKLLGLKQLRHGQGGHCLSVREISKSSNTLSATNISSNVI